MWRSAYRALASITITRSGSAAVMGHRGMILGQPKHNLSDRHTFVFRHGRGSSRAWYALRPPISSGIRQGGIRMRRRVAAGMVVLGLAVLGSVSAHGEATTLNVAKQYGLGYLQLMLMVDGKLIERQAAAGPGDVTVKWATFRSSDVMNDAVISGTVDFVCLRPPDLATIWAKTRGNLDVRGASGLNAMPLFLNTRNPAISSISDFTDKDRIAVPSCQWTLMSFVKQ